MSHIYHNLDIGNPIGVVLRSQFTSDEKNDVHDPPNSESADGEEFANSRSCLPKAKPVQAQETEEDRI